MNCLITITDGTWYAKFPPGSRGLTTLLDDGWYVVRIYRGFTPSPYMEML